MFFDTGSYYVALYLKFLSLVPIFSYINFKIQFLCDEIS